MRLSASDIRWSVTIDELWREIIKRIKAYLPMLFISSLIAYVVRVATDREYVDRIFGIFNDLLGWSNYGLASPSITGIVWYLSAMLFAIWIIYPVLRRHFLIYAYYVSPVLILLIYGFLINAYGNLEVPNEFAFGILNTGFLRGIAGISLGIFIHEIAVRISRISITKMMKCFLMFFEVSSFLVAIVFIFAWRKDLGRYDELAILCISVGLIILYSQQSPLYGRFDGKVTSFLGKYSMALFMNHFYLVSEVSPFEKMNLFGDFKIVSIISAFAVSLFVYFLINYLFPHISAKIKIHLKKYMLND